MRCYLLLLCAVAHGTEVKMFKFGLGKWAVNMVDETQFDHPEKNDFSDDIRKPIDFEDEYDELVARLPNFDLHKWGEEVVVTSVPIVTRAKPYWSTPSPRKFNEKAFSTPAVVLEALEKRKQGKLAVTQSAFTTRSTTPMPIAIEIVDIDKASGSFKETGVTLPTPKTPARPIIRTTTERLPVEVASSFAASTTAAEVSITTTTPASTTVQPASSRTPPVWRNPNFIRPVEVHPQLQQVNPPQQQVTVGRKQGFNSVTVGSGSGHVVMDSRGKPVELLFGSADSTPAFKFTPETTPTPPQFPIFNRPTPSWSRSWSSSWKLDANGNRIQEKTTVTETRDGKTETKTLPGSPEVVVPKFLPPPIIHTNPKLYRGPTFNCRVLNAATDGVASPENDDSCVLLFPGYPADESCRCTFKVNAREPNGCATNFLYTCQKIFRRS